MRISASPAERGVMSSVIDGTAPRNSGEEARTVATVGFDDAASIRIDTPGRSATSLAAGEAMRLNRHCAGRPWAKNVFTPASGPTKEICAGYSGTATSTGVTFGAVTVSGTEPLSESPNRYSGCPGRIVTTGEPGSEAADPTRRRDGSPLATVNSTA